MSDRYTLCIAMNNKFVSYGYYRNWFTDYLFYEALALAGLFDGCRSSREFHEKFHTYEEGEEWLSDERLHEEISDINGYSEMPLVVDLTTRHIYASYTPLCPKELFLLPVADTEPENYGRMLRSCRIPFSAFDLPGILHLLRTDSEVQGYFSCRTVELIEEHVDV